MNSSVIRTYVVVVNRIKRIVTVTCALGVLIVLQACSLGDLVNGSALPANVKDPKALRNATGAIALYHDAVQWLVHGIGQSGGSTHAGISSIVSVVGLFTDELQLVFSATSPLSFPTTGQAAIDSRTIPGDAASTSLSDHAGLPYQSLHTIRAASSEAIGALHKYAPDTTRVRIGHLYSIWATSEVLLAEMYCSGIPLSQLLFEGDYVLSEAKSTQDVLRHALKLVDSALLYGAGEARIENLARVTRGRALLGLGEYVEAAQAVSMVPDNYRYNLSYSIDEKNFFFLGPSSTFTQPWLVSVADAKGINGIRFISGGDPRTTATQITSAVYFPDKYATTGLTQITLASGVEARLIEAEAALHKRDEISWLNTINKLRTSGIGTVTPRVGDPTVNDTTWLAGAGATLFDGKPVALPGLRPLEDPGTDTARVSLLFNERAAWLFLTGHRLGDLRRLVRQYNRNADEVYPTGEWGPLRRTIYGTDVTLPVPIAEQQRNNMYRGCLSREA